MFTDTEIGIINANRRANRAFSNDVQGLIDEMDDDIISLRRQLAAAKAENSTLKAALGNRALGDLAAIRALKARAGKH
ncbi:MAG: hypothetical protein ACOH2M_18610 [Cypionkella sp.]